MQALLRNVAGCCHDWDGNLGNGEASQSDNEQSRKADWVFGLTILRQTRIILNTDLFIFSDACDWTHCLCTNTCDWIINTQSILGNLNVNGLIFTNVQIM